MYRRVWEEQIVRLSNTYSPWNEAVAYEALWAMSGATTKSIAEIFERQRGEAVLPSVALEREGYLGKEEILEKVQDYLRDKSFSVQVSGGYQYPRRLRDAKYPLELFYYRGDIGLLDSRCISVVGTRGVSEEGRRRTGKLTRLLVKNDFTIVSGLARGVDTTAHDTAIEAGGRTIGVIGTPIDEYHPRENRALQDKIAESYLLISQIPFFRYSQDHWKSRRRNFPERNATMSALSEATVIVEAGDTSGTRTQAKACINQKRKLFILNNCFETPNIKWPWLYQEQGAVRVKDFDDIINALDTDKNVAKN